jgi:hypothetical protein
VSGLCTPRVVMQWYDALIMTPTPCGSRASFGAVCGEVSLQVPFRHGIKTCWRTA